MRFRNKNQPVKEESELERKVDQMMDPRLPNKAAPAPKSTNLAGQPKPLPPLDIFSQAKSAPTLPSSTLKSSGGPKILASPPPAVNENVIADAGEEDPYNDAQSDAAVEDITKKDADTLLNASGASSPTPTVRIKSVRHSRFKDLIKRWWLWLIVLLILVLVAVAVPFSRYKLAGLVYRQSYQLTLTDSTTGTPISGARVTAGGQVDQTNSAGQVAMKLPVGHQSLSITKQYYASYEGKILVGFEASNDHRTVSLVATGRQVPVKVINSITGQPVQGADVRALDTKATTGSSGTAIIVLPVGKSLISGSVDASGFNTASVNVTVAASVNPSNTFRLTPSGRLYYLSNSSGKIDVASSNLDGSNVETVLAGTGNEDPNNTALSASHDWQYLALISQRNNSQTPSLYLINTTNNNQLTTIDNSNSEFSPIGWIGHSFIFMVSRPNTPAWQPGGSSIESYNADTNKLTTLANSAASGSSDADAVYQDFWNAYILGSSVVYATTWYAYPGNLSVSGQQDGLYSVNPDGSGAKSLKTVDASQFYITNLALVEPSELDFAVQADGGGQATVYQLSNSGTVSSLNTSPSQSAPSYLISPSNQHSFWSEVRNGANAMLIGDGSGANSKVIGTLSSDYAPYGWYTDNYVLLSYKSNTLYIMAASGSGQPLKIGGYLSSQLQPTM